MLQKVTQQTGPWKLQCRVYPPGEAHSMDTHRPLCGSPILHPQQQESGFSPRYTDMPAQLSVLTAKMK